MALSHIPPPPMSHCGMIAPPTALSSTMRPADDTKLGQWITPDGAGHSAAYVHRPGFDAYKHTSVQTFINGVSVPMDPPPMSPLTPTMGGTALPMMSAYPALSMPMSPLSPLQSPRSLMDRTIASASSGVPQPLISTYQAAHPIPAPSYHHMSHGATMNTPFSSVSSWNSGSFQRPPAHRWMA